MASPGYGSSGPAATDDQKLYQFFSQLDYNSDSHVEAPQLKFLFANGIDQDVNLETCRLFIDMMDRDYDGGHGFSEFKELLGAVKQWREAFHRFDPNKTGLIEPTELEQAIKTFGYNLSPQIMKKILYKFDSRERGSLSLDDFIRVCVSLRMTTEAFRQRDTTATASIKIQYEDFMSLAIYNKH